MVETRSGHYVATRLSREYAAGRLNMHRDGYGFLIPDRPIAGIQRRRLHPARIGARQAMHGDRVVVRISRIERDGRADGEIVGMLQARAPHRGRRVPRCADAATSSCPTTSASASGSRFPKAWQSRAAGATP